MNQRVRFFLFLAGLLAMGETRGQRAGCGTPAPDPTVYRSMVLRLKNRGARTAVGPLVYLPIKFHVVHRSDGSGNDVSSADLVRALEWLNERMAPANLQFYLSGSGVHHINNSTEYENPGVQDGTYALKHGARNAINVFVFNQLREGWAGYSYYPSGMQFSNCVFMNGHALKHQPDLLPHEMGHYFNLLHTHENNANEFAERVDGANCTAAGDLVCDTPADPFGLVGASNQGCTYTGTVRDAGGKLFTPDLRNLMGYWHTQGCQTNRFTSGQAERLYAGHLLRRSAGSEYTLDERPANLPAPALTVERPNATTARLRWGVVGGADGYLIERAPAADGPWQPLAGRDAGTLDYTDGGLSASQGYYYRIRAANALNYSAPVLWRNRQAQQIAFEAIPNQAVGDGPVPLNARSSSGLPVRFRVTAGPGELVSDSELKLKGPGLIQVEAYQSGSGEYEPATASQSCWVERMAARVTFHPVTDKTYGDPDFELSAESNRGVPLTFAVESGPGQLTGRRVHLTGAGTLRIRAFHGSTETIQSAEQVLTVIVHKAGQSIQFEPIPGKTYGDGPHDLRVRSTAALPLHMAVEGPAFVADNRLHITGAGTVRVTARQPGNENYHAAPEAVQTISVAKAPQNLRFDPLPDRVYGQPRFDLPVRSSSGLAPTYTIFGPARWVDGQLELTGAGSVTVTAAQAGDPNFLPAESQSRTFRVEKAAQTISFAPLGSKTYGDPAVPLVVSLNSPLAAQLSVQGPATLSGSLLTITGAGEVMVLASQPGDDNHHAATTVSQTFRVEKAPQVISFAPLSDRTYGDNPVSLSVSVNSALGVQLSVRGPATLNGYLLTLTGAGEVAVVAVQPGDANHHAATTVTQQFRVDKRRQLITLAELPTRVYTPDPFALQATSTSGRAMQYLVSGAAQLEGTDRVRLLRSGTVTVQVVQTGDENHHAADTVTRTFTVERAPQRIATNLPDLTFGTAFTHELPADVQPGLPLRYAVVDGPATLAGTRLTATDYGKVTLTLNQPGDDRYLPAPEVRRTFCLNPAVPTVRIDPSSELTLVSSSPFRNQWFFNGDSLRGATGVTYLAQRAGTYTVGVANPVAACNSQVRSAAKELAITGVEELVVAGFDVFPNPGTEAVRVRVRTDAAPRLSLLDALGRSFGEQTLHATAPGTYETELSVKHLSPGTYLLRVQAGTRGVTKRLVVR
jgi:hypothetical protein